MKTLIIWNNFEELAQFAIVETPYSIKNLDGAIINCEEDKKDEAKTDELNQLIYDENFNQKLVFEKEFPVGHQIDEIINVGFAP